MRFVHQYNRWWCDFCGRYQTPKTVRKRRAFERPRKPNDKRDSHFGIDFGFSSNKHGHKSRSKHWHRHQAALNKAKKDKPKILYSSSSTDYYEVRGDEVFAAGTNRSASMGAAIYKVRGDCLYKTGQHPDGPGGPATHRISADRIYKTSSIHSSNSKRSGSKFYRGLRKNEDED